MGKRKKLIIGAVLFSAVLVIFLAAVAIYRYLAPSNVKAEPDFSLAANETALIVDGEVREEKGIWDSEKIYIPADTAANSMDPRIYVDEKEKILSYASPDGLIRAEADSTSYRLSNKTEQAEEAYLKTVDDKLYVALSFIVEHSSADIQVYENPSRVVVHADRTMKYRFVTLSSDVRLRKGPGKKYPWVAEALEGDEVVEETSIRQENGYAAVTTEDGITGYIPAENLTQVQEKVWDKIGEPASFEQRSLGKTVCLGWHQITSREGGTALYSGIETAKPMNVISPTLFALSDNKGNFTSFADTGYVTKAHDAGLQVWGLINDFDKNINLEKILGTTGVRNKLVNALVGEAIRYELDGINVDFENVRATSAPAFLEFLRELVLKCHVNDIVVSVDAYTPAEYNAYYDLEEQGRVVDYIILMAYDEHYAGSETSGSVSSLGFVKNGIKNMLTMVPSERLVAALPFYTRLWHETKTKDGVKVSSAAYGMSGAESVLRAHDTVAKWDKKTGQYYGEFKGEDGTYKIWLEEETSLQKKLEAVREADIAGVAFWKLGFERAATWLTIENALK